MSIDWILAATIGGPILALLVGAALDRLLERRPRLLAYYGHVSSFTLRGPSGTSIINTHSVVVANGGRKPATNVRLGHHFLPDFQLSPSVQCIVEPLPSGGHELVLPSLVPGEQVTISYLYFPPITWQLINSYVKSDEGLGTVIAVLPTRQYPRWVVRTARVFLFVGIVATAYALVELIRWWS